MIVTLVSLVMPAAAQLPTWEIMATAGGTSSQFTGRSADTFGKESREGATIGVATFLRVWDELGFEFGIRYTQKGATGDILQTEAIPNFKNVTSVIGNAEFNLAYIEFPLLIAGILDLGDRANVRGYFGPSLAILVRGEAFGTLEGQPFRTNVTNIISDFDFVVTVGATVTYEFDAMNLLFDFRYGAGITSITKETAEYLEVKNGTSSMSIGLAFPIAGYDG